MALKDYPHESSPITYFFSPQDVMYQKIRHNAQSFNINTITIHLAVQRLMDGSF